MAVTDAWTDPSDGGALEGNAGDPLTDVMWDGVCSDLLYLGGTTGARGSTRAVWSIPRYHSTAANLVATLATYGTAQMDDGASQAVAFALPVPSDFTTLVKLVVIVIPSGTGNIYAKVDADYGANTQAYNVHTYAGSYAAVAATTNNLLEVDVSAAVASLAANDYLGLTWTRDASHASDTVGAIVDVLGLYLEYTTG